MRWPSAEWELVCCCSRRGDRFAGSAGSVRVAELIQAGVDAGLVMRLASVHGVAGLVGLNLCRAALTDTRLWSESHAAVLRQAARNTAMLEAVSGVMRRLSEAGIAVMPFKGPLMALRLYGDLGSRASADLDFLVRAPDLERVDRVLRAAGYKPRLDMDDRVGTLHRRAGWGCEYQADGSGVRIEFNSVLAPAHMGFRFGAGALFDGAQTQRIGSVDTLWPTAEALVIALCVHGAKHSWCRLSWLADLRAAWDAYPEMDVHLLLNAAAQHRLRRVVLLGHWLAGGLLGGGWPPALTEAIGSDDRLPVLGRRCTELLFSGQSPGTLAEWRFLSGVHDCASERIRYAARWALTPSWSDWQCVRLPESLEWAYYVVRPFRLLLSGWGRAIRRLR